jgi:hypothetical protein
MTFRDQITTQAMTLSPEDRAYVADMLERSLPEGDFSNPTIAEAWSREIDRRIEAYDLGETSAVDFDSALNHMRDAIAAYRSSKAGVQ